MNTTKILEKLKGKRGIFVHSDPAGAKACLALASKLSKESILAISDRQYSFYKDFEVEVNNYKQKNIADWLRDFQPEFVFTGTSIPVNIEINFLQEAQKRKIFTYSFIDHWINIKERFFLKDKYVFPNRFLVIDRCAKEMALNANIPGDIIRIIDNPYYDYLKNWAPKISKCLLFENLGIPKEA
jgi:hypothetical protein